MRNIFREKRQYEVKRIVETQFRFTNVLDVGSGDFPLANVSFRSNTNHYISFDKTKKADITGNALELTKFFEPDSIDCITALEIIEHFDTVEQTYFTEECLTVLKPNGILVLTLPNYSATIKPFQNLVWFIRERTTQREYLHNEELHTHVGTISPYWLRMLLLFWKFKILEERRFMLYDYIFVCQKVSQ